MCSILGPGRILVLLTACFITFYVRRALQQKHQCIIYCMCCRPLVVKIVNKFQSKSRILNVYVNQIQIQILKANSKIRTSLNIPSHYTSFSLQSYTFV